MNKNKKSGFTLVELLVAIVVLGIITALAFPAMRKLQQENKTKKYETYKNSAIESAKLYVDSYKEDMFSTDKNITKPQCQIITHNDIKDSYLFKEYNGEEGVNCQIEGTKILVVKVGNQYDYQMDIICKKAGKVVYENKNIIGTCDATGNYISDTKSPTVTLSTSSSTCSKNPTATVKIKDNGGLKENIYFAYAWLVDGKTSPTEAEKKYYSFSNAAGDVELTTTLNMTGMADGKYKLWVDTESIKDIYENSTTEKKVSSSAVQLDTTAPSGLTVTFKKWSDNDTRPTSSNYSSLGNYTVDSWSNKKIYTIASATDNCSKSAELAYKYTTTGRTTNEADKSGKARSIEANGTSYIKYKVCDEAGNCTDYTDNYTAKIDTVNPTCSISGSGTEGDNGWFKSNVALSLSTSDATSGVNSYDLTTNSTASYKNTSTGNQTSNSTGQKWYGYVKDNAGNTQKCEITIKKDSTKPTCSVSKTGTTGDDSWYKSDVTLTLTKSDSGGSGLSNYGLVASSTANYNSKTAGTQSSDTKGTTWYGYVKDNAGNTATCNSGSIKKDATVPSCAVSGSGTVGNNSWYTSNVAISLTKGDGTSGVKSYGLTTSSTTDYNTKASGTQSVDTTGTTWYGYVKDNAGNTKNCSNSFKKDATAPSKPTITVKKWDGSEPTEDNFNSKTNYTSNTWSNRYVKARASGSTDATSKGVYYQVTTTGATTNSTNSTTTYRNIKANGTSTIKFRACDAAGNCSGYSTTYTVKIDRVAPVYGDKIKECTANADGYYPFGYKVSDEHSGIDTSSTEDYFYYCYNVDSGWPAASCGTTCASGGLAANYNSAKSDKQLSGVSKGCTDHSKTNYIEAYFKICDKVGNCATKGSKTSPIKYNWTTCD